MSQPVHLLHVCTGNICRSPMAEVMSEAIGDALGIDVHARSAGTLGLIDRAAAANAIAVCREIGLDLREHRSQALSDELIAWADHILVMEIAHAEHLRRHHPAADKKILLLGPFAGTPEIADPVGAWRWRFRRIRKQLDKGLRSYFQRMC